MTSLIGLQQKSDIRNDVQGQRRRTQHNSTDDNEERSPSSYRKSWLFGTGDAREWGGDDANHPNNPIKIDIPVLLEEEYVTDVPSAGLLHSAVVTNLGRIFTAGSSSAGESRGLGRSTNGTAELEFMPITEVYRLEETAPTTESMPTFVKVVASQYYTVARDNLGNVWSTGNNAYGQLCLNDTVTRERFHQVRIPGDEKVIDIALGESHTLLIREDGTVFGCGWNGLGNMGIGLNGENILSPVKIIIDEPDKTAATTNSTADTINHEFITDAVAGRGTSYFKSASGHIFSAGE